MSLLLAGVARKVRRERGQLILAKFGEERLEFLHTRRLRGSKVGFFVRVCAKVEEAPASPRLPSPNHPRR
jgi:hypothetical protein